MKTKLNKKDLPVLELITVEDMQDLRLVPLTFYSFAIPTLTTIDYGVVQYPDTGRYTGYNKYNSSYYITEIFEFIEDYDYRTCETTLIGYAVVPWERFKTALTKYQKNEISFKVFMSECYNK